MSTRTIKVSKDVYIVLSSFFVLLVSLEIAVYITRNVFNWTLPALIVAYALWMLYLSRIRVTFDEHIVRYSSPLRHEQIYTRDITQALTDSLLSGDPTSTNAFHRLVLRGRSGESLRINAKLFGLRDIAELLQCISPHLVDES